MSTLPPLHTNLPSLSHRIVPLRSVASLTSPRAFHMNASATRDAHRPQNAFRRNTQQSTCNKNEPVYRVHNDTAREVLRAFLGASADRMALVAASATHLAPLTTTSELELNCAAALLHQTVRKQSSSPVQSMDTLISLSETSEHDSLDGTVRGGLHTTSHSASRKRPASTSCEQPILSPVAKKRRRHAHEKSTDETILLAMFPHEHEMFVYDSVVNSSTIVGEVVVSKLLTIADIRTVVQRQLAMADPRIAKGAFELAVKGQNAVLMWHQQL